MTSTSLDHILALPPTERLRPLLDLAEDQWLDRKSSRISPRSLAETLVAFANADGGTVVIGLHDGSFDGDKLTSEKENALRQASIDFTSPPVRVDAVRIDLGGSRAVLCLGVTPGERVHETSRGDCFLRVGDESRKLTYSQRRELTFDRGASQFDGEPVPGATTDDLDPNQIGAYRNAIGSTADDATALRARNLLDRQGELTVAAVLLLGKWPEAFFPNATVRVLRFADVRSGTGSRQTLEAGKDLRFSGPIPTVIDSAAACMADWIPKRRTLAPSGRFEDVPVIPRDAWLEGLVNSVVHRSYSLAGDHIRVSIFPDRVEIESPGRFPGLADPRRPLDIARYARNPRIARVCADLGITLERGEGIRRMFDEMRGAGLVDPSYTQTSGSVHLRLAALPRLSDDVSSRLPPGADAIIDFMREFRVPMGTGEIMDATGRSRPWVRNTLEALREEGIVTWSGKSPRDPHATWSLADY